MLRTLRSVAAAGAAPRRREEPPARLLPVPGARAVPGTGPTALLGGAAASRGPQKAPRPKLPRAAPVPAEAEERRAASPRRVARWEPLGPLVPVSTARPH